MASKSFETTPVAKHAAYWQEYQKAQVRGALRIFLTIVTWIVLIVLVVLAQDIVAGALPLLLAVLFLGLIISVLVQGRNVYRVVCPECSTTYKRHKWGGECPSCGLKLLQHEP